MNKKIVTTYTFNAAAQTVASPEFVDITKIALITNITDGEVIYDPLEPTLGGTLSNNGVLTLEFNTTAMSNTDLLQIVLHTGTELERIGFTKAISNGVDSDFFTLRQTGSGMTVNQTGGELVITSGTTARAETIIRSNRSFIGGIRARITNRLSQRIINQQFIYELVDVIGDGLSYTINSATSITVTFPASYGLSSQDVGRSVTLCQFSGTGTFLSGRYAIASVSGNDATITVAGFAAGTGTVSVVGMNFYRLLYDGATATSASFDVARGGYAWSQKTGGGNVATITTTTSATPGHQLVITGNDGIAYINEDLTANATASSLTDRGKRVTNIPDDIRLFLQIRVLNLGTAPASTTTWNIEQVSVAYFEPTSVAIQDVRPTNFSSPLNVKQTIAAPTQAVTLTSTTITALTPGVAATNSHKARDAAAGATDTNQPIMLIRRDAPTAVTPVAGDYEVPQMTNLGAQYVAPTAHTAGGATPFRLVSAATTNATSVKASAGQVYSITAMNQNAAVRYLKLYNLATAPTVGTSTPVQVYALPPSGGITLSFPVGMAFSTGIALATTTGAADSDTGAVALNEIVISLTFL